MENLMALLIEALGEYEAQKAQIVARDDSAEIEQAVEGYRERLIRSYEEKKAAQIAENEIFGFTARAVIEHEARRIAWLHGSLRYQFLGKFIIVCGSIENIYRITHPNPPASNRTAYPFP